MARRRTPPPALPVSGKLTRIRTVDQIDRRSGEYRLWQAYVDAFVAQCGGHDHVSPVKLAMIRNLASLQITLDEMTANKIEGDVPFFADAFAKLSGQAQRLASVIGLDWTKASKAPTLAEIMKEDE